VYLTSSIDLSLDTAHEFGQKLIQAVDEAKEVLNDAQGKNTTDA